MQDTGTMEEKTQFILKGHSMFELLSHVIFPMAGHLGQDTKNLTVSWPISWPISVGLIFAAQPTVVCNIRSATSHHRVFHP